MIQYYHNTESMVVFLWDSQRTNYVLSYATVDQKPATENWYSCKSADCSSTADQKDAIENKLGLVHKR